MTREILIKGLVLLASAIALALYLYIQILQYRAFKEELKTGPETFPGKEGQAQTPLDPQGRVTVRGESWKARSHDGGTIEQGKQVIVVTLEEMELIVKPIN